jgi:Flp pilus assembly pilin Flp
MVVKSALQKWIRFLTGDNGLTASEYALILAVVLVVVLNAIVILR